MARLRKCYIHNSVVEVSASVQQGRPFVATPYMRVLIEGCLAAAQSLYPVRIVSYLQMENHFHMIIVVDNPENVSAFLCYFKSQTAHSINRLLGRRQQSFWIAGCDSPTILTAEDVQRRLRYHFLNPSRAGIVNCIKDYPSISTFDTLLTGAKSKKCRKVELPEIPLLPKRALSLSEQEQLAGNLESANGRDFQLNIEPWAWLDCFPEANLSKDVICEELLKDIAQFEEEYENERTTPCTGAHLLRLRDPRQPYESKRSGKRTVCICSSREVRALFIDWFKEQVQLAQESYRRWRTCNGTNYPPPGFFLPGGMLVANLLSIPISL